MATLPRGSKLQDLNSVRSQKPWIVQISKVLARRQARWAEILLSYHFVIEHLEGQKNRANGPSRRPDYQKGYERPTTWLLATLTAPTVELYDNLLPAIKAAQASDSLATDVKCRIVNTPIIGASDLSKAHVPGGPTDYDKDLNKQWKVVSWALTYAGRTYIPADASLRNKVISLFHVHTEFGHFGALRTAELVTRDFCCPAQDATMRKFIAGWEVCHRNMAPRHACHRVNMPLPPPSASRQGISMDFVTDIPESATSSDTGINVIVDRLTQMAIYLPCRKDINWLELTRMCFENVIYQLGIPDYMITYHGP